MSYRATTIVVLTAAVALAGCTAAKTPQAAPTPGVSATSSAPAATAPTTPSQGGTGGGSGWSGADFAKLMFKQLACPDFDEAEGKAEVTGKRYTDLTGDGRAEAVVTAACFTTTAANPAHVVVFDGDGHRPLLDIGRDQHLTTAKVTIDGDSLTVVSDALSDQAPRCCPDLRITQTYAWDGDAFGRTSIDRKQL